MTPGHTPRFAVGTMPELFYAVAVCECGYVTPPCYTLAAADRVHRRHVETLPVPTAYPALKLPEPEVAPAWYDWSADTFDADVREREELAQLYG